MQQVIEGSNLDEIAKKIRTLNPPKNERLQVTVKTFPVGLKNGATPAEPDERTGRTIQCDPDIMSGTPCFPQSRVPIGNLIDYIEGGETLEKFLDDFPSVSRKKALAVLEVVKNIR